MGSEFYITSDQDGRRLDRLLRTLWPGVPLGAIMKALRTGEVRLDAKKAKPDTRLAEGQFLQVPWNDKMGSGVENVPEEVRDMPALETVFCDDYLWLVNKPAGLLTQPDVKGGDSLVTRALAELGWNRADFRPSAVQRLDRNTSGIIIIALAGAAQRTLSDLIRTHDIKKIYRAVVEGETPDSGEINFSLLKDCETNIVRTDPRGQKALTRYRTLCRGAGTSSVEAELITGRSHQVRVHMAAIGHPVLGDRKYGSGKGAKRTLLHAYSLTFPDVDSLPEHLRGATYTANMPDDMKKYFSHSGSQLA